MLMLVYMAPFFLVARLAYMVCFFVPITRPYRHYAFAAPVAFGFCSISAMGLAVIVAHVAHADASSRPLSGIRGGAVLLLIYVIPGAAEGWIAIRIVKRLEARNRN